MLFNEADSIYWHYNPKERRFYFYYVDKLYRRVGRLVQH